MKGARLPEKGSLSVEALLIMPLIIMCLVLLIRTGPRLQQDLETKNLENHQVWMEKPPQPADWIRKTDLLLDWGRGLSTLLPEWR